MIMRLIIATNTTSSSSSSAMSSILKRGVQQQQRAFQSSCHHYNISPSLFSNSNNASLPVGNQFCRSTPLTFHANKAKSIQQQYECHSSSFSTAAATNENEKSKLSIADTPLGKPECASLLNGLDVYTVPAEDDDHPITVYGIHSSASKLKADEKGDEEQRKPILLLHGRTWSSVPVYHLLGGGESDETKTDSSSPSSSSSSCPKRQSRSLMEALHTTAKLQPYALDFRGFGGTPPDTHHYVEPNRCVKDAESVLKWIAARHGLIHHVDEEGDGEGESYCEMPALLGWSQGALVAQLLAQKSPHLISKLTLYGSIYDPQILYPRPPLYSRSGNTSSNKPKDANNSEVIYNDYDAAIEDFTIEGTIEPEPAQLFAEAALMSDPVKVKWVGLYQFNNCDPARVNVPTLVVVGDQDPYAPLRVQGELFANLGRGADRQWSIISGADHAVHLLDGRARFIKIVKSFVENGSSSSS